MSMEERHGSRDLTYSGWHRPSSTGRFLGDDANLLTMIDIDAVEYDAKTLAPVGLIETARGVEMKPKCADVTRRVASILNCPAFIVHYRRMATMNPGNERLMDIYDFSVREVWPRYDPKARTMSPLEYAQFLLSLRNP